MCSGDTCSGKCDKDSESLASRFYCPRKPTMTDNNEKFKWLKPFLQLFVFALLTSTVCADNSTDYTDDDLSELEPFLLIQPAPMNIPQCGINELYQSCEVGCIDCEQRGMCEPQNCHISHCDCRMYFVHITPGGPCEHVSLCPARECPENEVYRHCGPFCEYCDMAPCRKMECSSRCYCKQGYRRDRETGKCVPEKECPQRLDCYSNDEVADSGPASEHCMQTEDEALRVNETIEEKKCYCPSGFKRNIHGWCIEEELCGFVTCVEQTVFQDCPRKCNTTCWNYGDPDCVEDGQCYPSCFCDEGYVLNEFFACVPLEMCPPGSNPYAPPLPPPPTIGPMAEPALEETSEASAAATEESGSAAEASSSSGTGSGSASAASSSSGGGSGSAAAASSSSGGESSSAAAASSSSEGGSGSAEAASSSSGTGSSSAAAAESSQGSGSAAAESSSEKESSSAAAEASSGGDSAATAESTAGTESSTGVAEGSEKTKEIKETKSGDDTTEAPKKPPKKATSSGKIYKSAARKGKTVAPMDEDDA